MEEVGTVTAVQPVGGGVELTITAVLVRDGLGLGDSVSHDGVCLTVTTLTDGGYTVQAVSTTLERTTLGTLRPGSRVNLERALAFGSRLGGHLVQGHVDAVGRVLSVTPRGELTLIDIQAPDEVAGVTVLHGSITVSGVSLTVNELPAPGVVQVSIIPFTMQHTNFGGLRAGDGVNLEGDLIGRYVRHLLGAPATGSRPAGEGSDLLRAWGY